MKREARQRGRGRGRAEAGLPAQITHTPRPPRPPPSTAVGNRSAAAAAAAVGTITSSCIQRTRNPRRGRYTFKKALKKRDSRTTISFMFARVCACLWFAFANWQNCLAWAINKNPHGINHMQISIHWWTNQERVQQRVDSVKFCLFYFQKGATCFPLVFHITTNFRNFVYSVADVGKFKKTIPQVLNKQSRREMKVFFLPFQIRIQRCLDRLFEASRTSIRIRFRIIIIIFPQLIFRYRRQARQAYLIGCVSLSVCVCVCDIC